MIIDPDFLDHWRTQMLADQLDDDRAPLYVIRLWAHCQQRRHDRFDMPAAGLKAVCRYPGNADQFEAAMIACEFAERDGEEIIATGWAEYNASLIAAWKNGARGGRKKGSKNGGQGQPEGNPEKTHGFPTGSPSGTQGEPPGEASRVEESREEDTQYPDGYCESPESRDSADDAPPAGGKRTKVPHQKIIQLYHEKLPNNPTVTDVTDTLRNQIRARWNNGYHTRRGKHVAMDRLDQWGRLFDFIAEHCPFLTGDKPGTRGHFRPNLQWLTKRENFAKIVAREYVDED